LNALAVKILAKANENDEDVFELKYSIPTAKGYSTKVKIFAEIPVPRGTSTKEPEEKSRKKAIERKAKRVGNILERLCRSTQDCKSVLFKLVKDQGGSLFWDPFFLGIADIIAIRLRAGGTAASTNMILRVLGAVGILLGVTKFLAPQAKKRIGDFERNALPIDFKIATCNIAHGKEAACVFYWIKNVCLLIERLICSSIVAGKQQPSFKFSSFKDVHIIYDNIDRGGGDLIHMLRNGNREDGNTSEYCIPISVVESASEDHANLKKTVLSKERGEVVQMMLDKKLSILEIHVPECGDVRCIIMELASSKKIAQVTVGLLEDEIFQSIDDEGYEEFRRCSVTSEDRKLPDKIVVPSDTAALEHLDDGRWHLTLSLQMVQVKTNDVDQSSYVGCRLPDFEYSFKFDLSVPITLSKESEAIWAKWMPVICFPAHDGKMMTHVCGLGSCGVTFPCPCCIRRIDCESLPAWAAIEFPEEVEGIICEDFPLQKGDYSYAALSAKNKQLLGPNHEFSAAEKESTIPKATINATRSVNSEILQRLEPELINCDGMHITQGYMTHLTEEAAFMLAQIFKDGGWAEKNKEVMQEKAKDLVSTKKSLDYSAALKRDNACKRMYNATALQLVGAKKECVDLESKLDALKVAAAVVELELQNENAMVDNSFEAAETAKEYVVEAEEKCVNSATRVAELTLELENLAEKRESESEDSGFGFMNRLIKGGKEMLTLIESGPTNKRLRRLNKPEFIFLQSVRKYAGSFNKQHGSMELTHGRGMNALEKREAIYTLTCEGVKDDDAISKKKVKEVMDWWLKMAGYLFEISTFSKSQKKVTDERLQSFKCNLVKYGVAWRKRISYKKTGPVFWKMHEAECAYVSWVSLTRISGKGDAQGFENKHHQMKGMKALLAPMVKTGQRVAKLSQRQQIFLSHEISEKMEFIEDKTERRGKRQSYKTKGKSARALENVDALESDEIEEYIELENGGLLPEEMSAFYNFYKRSHMPEEWYESIQNFASLGSKVKNEAKFFE
jgi:hypothetical protein